MWVTPEHPDFVDEQFEVERRYVAATAETFASWDDYRARRAHDIERFTRPGQTEELQRLFDAHHSNPNSTYTAD